MKYVLRMYSFKYRRLAMVHISQSRFYFFKGESSRKLIDVLYLVLIIEFRFKLFCMLFITWDRKLLYKLSGLVISSGLLEWVHYFLVVFQVKVLYWLLDLWKSISPDNFIHLSFQASVCRRTFDVPELPFFM